MSDTYRIADLVSPGSVLVKKRILETTDNLFTEISLAAAAACGPAAGNNKTAIPPRLFLKALKDRAARFPIGTAGGILLPLGNVRELDRFIGVFVKLTAKQTVGETPDGMPVDLIFALFGPKDDERTDLRLLAYIAHVFSSQDLREELRETQDIRKLHSALTSSAFRSSSVPKPAG